jgi:hypothetical protein
VSHSAFANVSSLVELVSRGATPRQLSQALRTSVTPAGPAPTTTNSLNPSLYIALRPCSPRTSLLQVVVVEAVVLVEGLAYLHRHLAHGLGP